MILCFLIQFMHVIITASFHSKMTWSFFSLVSSSLLYNSFDRIIFCSANDQNVSFLFFPQVISEDLGVLKKVYLATFTKIVQFVISHNLKGWIFLPMSICRECCCNLRKMYSNKKLPFSTSRNLWHVHGFFEELLWQCKN